VKVALISANLGKFEKTLVSVPQNTDNFELNTYLFTDENFPPRDRVMSPRLQAKIPKMFGWQMAPGHDFYVWMDAAAFMSKPNAVIWMLTKLGNHDIAFFVHPHRRRLRQEFEFLRQELPTSNRLKSRYMNELLEEQFEEIDNGEATLCAAGIFAYRANARVRALMKEWWYNTSRYHINDQLSLPHCLTNSDCSVKYIQEDIFNCKYFTFGWRLGRK